MTHCAVEDNKAGLRLGASFESTSQETCGLAAGPPLQRAFIAWKQKQTQVSTLAASSARAQDHSAHLYAQKLTSPRDAGSRVLFIGVSVLMTDFTVCGLVDRS